MTTLRSGNIPTGTNTPSGALMKVAVDNPYVTRDELVASFEAQGLGIDANIPQYSSGELDRKILQASAWINRHCRRWFDTQTIDETKTGIQIRPFNPQMVSVVLMNRPYSKINSIYLQVLKWFIQVDVGASGYLQDFPDKGFYRIVPMLSSAGTGVGSPMPAMIADRTHIAVLWTNYTFGYGTPLTGETLIQIGNTHQYQAVLGNRLWAPDQTLNVYDGTTLLALTTGYSVDFPNGMVTLVATPAGAVTADFTTNESIPAEIKEACILLTCHLIGQAGQNPIGADSMGIQTFNISFGKDSKVEERAKKLLEPYVSRMPTLIGI
jgi:hypothetical protein